MHSLLFATVGETVIVHEIKGDDQTKMFIQKLGIVPDASIQVLSSNDGDLIVFVKDVRVALTKSMASRIIVAEIVEK